MAYIKGFKPKEFVLMHRLILGILDNPKIETDHKNHNRLDNRRSNIRRCTRSENRKNSTAYGSSKYLGVNIANSVSYYYDKIYCYKQIRAKIKINGKDKHLGVFTTEAEAARAYDVQAKLHHGEFANCNF